jgi:SRSO17 transposase
MSVPREPKATVRFVDQYCSYYRAVFPEVRSFEQFTALHLGMIAELPRKTLPAIAAMPLAPGQAIVRPMASRRLAAPTLAPGRQGLYPARLLRLPPVVLVE